MTPLKRKASEMASSPAATEAEELAALDKALTALGFTDDSKLERVLHVLMPRVVDQMASAHASTKKKVMEILSHVNKRLKAQPTMRLPLEDLTALYVNPERPPMVRNFALVYVEQAHARDSRRSRRADRAHPPRRRLPHAAAPGSHPPPRRRGARRSREAVRRPPRRHAIPPRPR